MRKILCLCLVFTLCLCLCSCKSSDYKQAIELFNAGDYQQAMDIFIALEDYKDSVQKIKDCELAIATALMETDVVQAYDRLMALNGYGNSTELAHSIYVEYELELIKNAVVGDVVYFGTYEQDNDTSNGQERIQWLVLDKKDDSVFLISAMGLDRLYYKDSATNTSWADSYARKWLNSSFLNNAFTPEEQNYILTTTLPGDKAPAFTDPDTQDHIFLLNREEAKTYFTSDADRVCEPTLYADERGVYTLYGVSWWGLRDRGENMEGFTYVQDNGAVNEVGPYSQSNFNGFSSLKVDKPHEPDGIMRPAMWIGIEP